MTPTQLSQLQQLLDTGNEHAFYLWGAWRMLRQDVLNMDNHECQICKTRHKRFRPATIVHHVKHLRDRPDLALSIWDGDDRQLVSVCKQCHEDEHPESLRGSTPTKPPLTEERWD